MQDEAGTQLDVNWLGSRFKEVLKWNPEASIFDGLLYATVCLWRDIEPGEHEGEANLYDIYTTPSASELARSIGMDRTSLWRRVKDFRIDRGNSSDKEYSLPQLQKGFAATGA